MTRPRDGGIPPSAWLARGSASDYRRGLGGSAAITRFARDSRARIASILYSDTEHHSNEIRLATDMGKQAAELPSHFRNMSPTAQ